MSDHDPPPSGQDQHTYLDVGSIGPRWWVLLFGGLFLLLALTAAFYGLYTINRTASPSISPSPMALGQAMPGSTQLDEPTTVPIQGTQTPVTPTPLLTPEAVITATVEPPTYTVQQGDTLIAISRRLNVDANTLSLLNQLGGETIYPDQVLLVPPTVTPWPSGGPFLHAVSTGETLISIAAQYRVTVAEIKELNGLTSDTIFSGQQLLIPEQGIRPPTPTPTPEPWQPAVITGELDAVYSLSTIKGHFTLHIPPNTRAATDSETDKIAHLVETSLDHITRLLRRPFSGRFNMFVADMLFGSPYTHRRSFTVLDQNRLFLLYDGTGTPSERLYFITHALTPLVVSDNLSDTTPSQISEGLAVYVAGQALTTENPDYLSPRQFCIALVQTANLPSVSGELRLEGHLGYLDQHLAAGCFVGYLIEEYGVASFWDLYHDGDYRSAYGQTLDRLETAWIASLREANDALTVDAGELLHVMTGINAAYRRLWADFDGTSTQFLAYTRLDRARLSLLQGRLDVAQAHLERLETILDTE